MVRFNAAAAVMVLVVVAGGCTAASPLAAVQPTPEIIYVTPPPASSSSLGSSEPAPTPIVVYVTAAPTATPPPTPKPTPRPTPRPTLKPVVHLTKTTKLTLVESYGPSDPWYVLETGGWVSVWCPAGYAATAGSYDFVYPTWQSVVGSRSTSKSGRKGWEFQVQIEADSGDSGTVRGHLYATCRS